MRSASRVHAPLGVHVVLQPRVLPAQGVNRLGEEGSTRGGGPHRTPRLHRRRVLVLLRQRLAGRRLRAGQHEGGRGGRSPRRHVNTTDKSRDVSEAPSRTVAHMEASSPAPNELAQLLEGIATALTQDELRLVLKDLPMPELVRLACVHKAFQEAWQSLQEQHPGRRYSPPSARDRKRAKNYRRLERACFLGDVAVIQSTVAANRLLLTARDMAGHRTVDKVLWLAAVSGRVQSLELLLALGASVRSRNNRALRQASENGHADVVQFLVQRGANVHADCDQALQVACEKGHAEVVQLLIKHGANVHARNYAALRTASQRSTAHIMQLLLQHGADVHANDDEALKEATEHAFAAVVACLIQHGANVHAGNDWALRLSSARGNADLVQLLLQHGADVHADNDQAFRWAFRNGHTGVVHLLLQHGADVSADNHWALLWASKGGRADMVQLLIQHGVDVHARDDEALREATKKGHAAVVQLLIQHGAHMPNV